MEKRNMARPLPEGCEFTIARRSLPGDYEMPTMEAATDHYTIGYHISGSRTTITPSITYTQHPGYVGTLAPFVYHRTIPASKEDVYESILIKYTITFAKPFTDVFGIQALNRIYDHPTNRFEPKIQDRIYHLLLNMLDEYEQESPYRDFALQCMLFQILILILDKRLPDNDVTIYPTPLTPPIIEALYFMEKHYPDRLSLETVAGISGFSPAHFSKVFQSQLGKSYSEYLSDIRLKHVQELLLTTKKTITEIALETGYTYPGNLTEQFKRKIGMTPMAYRKHTDT